MPDGWVEARYETATHYLIDYLMEPDSEFKNRWESFCNKWDKAKGLEMRVKQQEIKYQHQGFSDPKTREVVIRALKKSKTRAAGTIDILRLDKILIAEKMSPLIALNPKGFVAKTPGSKKEQKYRSEGVPNNITDSVKALKYIKQHGPPISQTASTIARGNRDPRIKAWRCFSEWVRWMEVEALKNLIITIQNEPDSGVTVTSLEELIAAIRNK